MQQTSILPSSAPVEPWLLDDSRVGTPVASIGYSKQVDELYSGPLHPECNRRHIVRRSWENVLFREVSERSSCGKSQKSLVYSYCSTLSGLSGCWNLRAVLV